MVILLEEFAFIPSNWVLENDSSNAGSSTSTANDSFQTSQETLHVPRSEAETETRTNNTRDPLRVNTVNTLKFTARIQFVILDRRFRQQSMERRSKWNTRITGQIMYQGI